jgi:phage tail sheath protein FI
MSKVFVSPGVYTSEKDLSFVVRQVGVTTLGLVGETTIGPAFQPIFIGNYGEFQSFFGGTNPTKVKTTGAPKYELPYIAKSYLSQANQLFVTRVLGFSGYDAGLAWGITLQGALDSTTIVSGTPLELPVLISYSASTSGTVYESPNALVQTLIDGGTINNTLALINTATIGVESSVNPIYVKNGAVFSGLGMSITLVSRGQLSGELSGVTTGTTSGTTTVFTGSAFVDVENKLVALLRSRGGIDVNTQSPSFEITGSTGVSFNQSVLGGKTDAKGDFVLEGISTKIGAFNNLLSFDKTKKNFLPRVLGRTVEDGNTPIFVEEYYGNMFDTFNQDEKIYGINYSIVNYDTEFSNYKQEFQPAVTPYVVSELRGDKLLKLFRFHTISDGNAANEQFKISIRNIKLDTREFDVVVRAFYDSDVRPTILETFSRCTMEPSSNNYIARRIGTLDGEFNSKSAYLLIEMDDTADTSDSFPAGFVGYPIRDYQTNTSPTVKNPTLKYKEVYGEFENKRKVYLGLSETAGIDADFFDYKGLQSGSAQNEWTETTSGFHMDIDASNAKINNVEVAFETGNAEFRTETGVLNTSYDKLYSRKFTFAPYGGYDGWDVYRTERSNNDSYIINGINGVSGRNSEAFKNRTLPNGDLGINSDYYAYLEAIWTFKNPEAVNVNVFATPGIDAFNNSNLVEATIDMVETDRADSLYIMTTPDTDGGGQVMSVADVTSQMDGQYDSNYSCTYWPWIQINDNENNVNIYVPPTRDVVRNIALTDNISFPWFAVAGVQRGNVSAIKARKTLTLSERDELYENRINPIATFTSDGIKIWGNKTLQVKESALNRINVRRLLLQARKLISAVSIRLLFEQNDSVVRNQFLSLVNPILDNIRSERGLTDFRVVLSNDPEDVDRNQLTGQIFLKPTKSLEFIQLEFVIMNTGASFDNI